MNISIVIPVYNVEKYLRKCLDSVCAQSDCVKEIILVNDGSTDGSLNICNEYALKDARIKIIDKENQGTEQAIIDGVNAAACEYIGFVDSDDYIEPNMFSALHDSIERSGAKIALCRYSIVDENYEFVRNCNLGTENGVYEKTDGRFPIKLLPLLNDRRFIASCRWNKLVARELLVNNVAFAASGLRVGEDTALMIPVAMSASKIACVDDYLYHYVLRKNSVMRSYDRRNLTDWEKTVEILRNASEVYGYKFEDFGDSALALLLTSCLVPVRHSDMSRSQRKREYKYIGSNPTVQKLLREVKIKVGFKKKIVFKLLKHKFYGLLSLVYR
ncbi:MAG: glycosyltransferase [Clostridiales bacterium]|nr:glycosyltransferase [Clostridiales bacterium]